ncbi:hypothetical protein R9R72_15205, partial [Escherichia coli]
KTSIFSHPVYLFLRKFSLQDSRGGSVLRYFSALEEGINLLPGFAPELQGVYIEEHDGRKQVWCYVIKPRDAQSILLKGEKL